MRKVYYEIQAVEIGISGLPVTTENRIAQTVIISLLLAVNLFLLGSSRLYVVRTHMLIEAQRIERERFLEEGNRLYELIMLQDKALKAVNASFTPPEGAIKCLKKSASSYSSVSAALAGRQEELSQNVPRAQIDSLNVIDRCILKLDRYWRGYTGSGSGFLTIR